MLRLVLGVFLVLALVVATLTPPWEANDEPDHVLNVETIAGGSLPRIEAGGGFEPHQAPLYYVLLAGLHRAGGLDYRRPAAPFGTPPPNFRHDVATDGADHRRVVLFRLLSVLLGFLTIIVTFFVARQLTSDPWTPVVAAAVVAGVPKFVFLSGVVNNDNLANTLGALVTLATVTVVLRPPASSRSRLLVAAGLGVLLAALFLTKVSAAALGLAVVLAAVFMGRRPREWIALTAVVAGVALLLSSWWLIRNQRLYGDPLAYRAAREYFPGVLPQVIVDPSVERAVRIVPRELWWSFWYSSGWNQFRWPDSRYLPFWLLAGASLLGLFWRRRGPPLTASTRRAVLVLAFIAASAISTVWLVGMSWGGAQGRLAFVGLPAIACLIALGLERLAVPIPARFALPILGMLATCHAIYWHVLTVYRI